METCHHFTEIHGEETEEELSGMHNINCLLWCWNSSYSRRHWINITHTVCISCLLRTCNCSIHWFDISVYTSSCRKYMHVENKGYHHGVWHKQVQLQFSSQQLGSSIFAANLMRSMFELIFHKVAIMVPRQYKINKITLNAFFAVPWSATPTIKWTQSGLLTFKC